MSAVLKVVLEADFHERVALHIPANHGNVRDNQHLRDALEQLISAASSASGLDEMADELLLWTKMPFDNMAQVIQVLVEDGWIVVSLHENHAKLRREV